MNNKIDRSAFLYLETKEGTSYGKPEDFAQCKTCPLFTGDKNKTCFIHGKKLVVNGSDTCGLYCNGEPLPELAGKEKPYVTSEESGFARRAVRCQNCAYFNPLISQCKLFFILDTEFPDDFELGSNVSKFGCCNANISKQSEDSEPKQDAILRYAKKILSKKFSLKQLFSGT